jgi:RNA-binding protein
VSLTGKQRRHLRGLAHALRPVVQIGKGGLDAGLVAAVERALADHELVKIKVGEGAGVDRHDAADALAQQTHSEIAQVLGNTIVLYRADPDDPKIELNARSRTR